MYLYLLLILTSVSSAMFNGSEISFENFHNPRLVRFYKIFWETSLVYTTISFLLMLFLVVRKSSHEMGAYKWYLVHQLFWSFIFDLHLSTWKPVTLWPFFLAYSAGWWSNITGKR